MRTLQQGDLGGRPVGGLQPRPFSYLVVVVVGLLLAGLLVPYVRVAATKASTETGMAPGAAAGVLDPNDPGAAGSTGSAGEGGTGVAGAPGSGANGTGTAGASGAVGVTPTEIHLGIGILDIGIAKDFGFNFDIGDQRARWDALIASVNGGGGIHGRKVVPHYRVVEAAKQETYQAACIGWTKDDKVFTVFISSTATQSAAVCVIGPGATPFFTSDGVDESYYANGLYYSTQPNDNRILRDQAHYLLDKGALNGKTVGVLTGDGAERLAVDRTLVPELARGGVKVAAVEVIPATTSGVQKAPIAISNFKAKGVDFIIIAANVVLAAPFVQQAERSGLDAEYSLSDFNNQINDQVAGMYPDSFDGTIGLSNHRFPEYRAGNPPPPADQACLDIVRKVDPKVWPSTNSAFEVATQECGMWTLWVAGLRNAGPNLTQASLVGGIEGIGPTPIAGTLDGSYGPGKHDGGNMVREVAWRRSCECWEIAGPPRPMR